MTAFDVLTARLAGYRPAGEGRGRSYCPVHQSGGRIGGNRSLSIADSDAGGALLHCHAGCAVDAVLAAIGMTVADAMPAAAPAQHYTRPDTSWRSLASEVDELVHLAALCTAVLHDSGMHGVAVRMIEHAEQIKRLARGVMKGGAV